MITTAQSALLSFVGLPARSWAFAIRIWISIVVALYVSFWLQLEAPSTAALTVCILALPTRGQGLEKAGFRLIATLIGLSASVVITGLFAQTDIVILAIFAVWLGICVFAAGLLDGNRAYAAALCCTTVALIAIWQLDTPQHVFVSGLARGSAIVVGVLTVALVNEVLAAPDYFTVLVTKLKSIQSRLTLYAETVAHGHAIPDGTAGRLLRDIAALRPDVASLATELSSGHARSAAARATIVDLVSQLFAVRALALLPGVVEPAMRDQFIRSIRAGADRVSSQSAVPEIRVSSQSLRLMETCRFRLLGDLLRTNAQVCSSLDALQSGTRPPRDQRAPLYRSRRIAAESGVRAAIHFALVAAFFVIAGWPSTNICLALAAVVLTLGSTTPNPRTLTAVATIVAPIACLLVGILTFLILDGVSDFPLLAIALAPFVVGPALLMTLPSPILAGFGRLCLVFIVIVFAPSNPPTYNPQSFLFTSLFLCMATVLCFAAQLLVPPLSSDRRLNLLLAEAHHDLNTLSGADRSLTLEEAMFRDAVRIEQIVTMAGFGSSSEQRQAADDAIYCFDRASILRLCFSELAELAGGPLADAVETARRALQRRSGEAIAASAASLHGAAEQEGVAVDAVCAHLRLAGVAFTGPAAKAALETIG